MSISQPYQAYPDVLAANPKKSPRGRYAPWLAAAAALAGMALYVRHQTRKAERDNPPAGRFINVDGVRLHYIERGEGPPVVFLHGNGTMALELEESGLLDMAAGKYRVIAFDRPGYGYSDRPRSTVWGPQAQAELLYRALAQLGVERPVVVAHSWGTLVAIGMALNHPTFIRSLVLLSGYYYPTPRLDVPLSSPPAIPVIGDLMRHTISPLLGRLVWPAIVRKMFAPAETAERFREEYPVWMSLRPSHLRATTEEIAMMIPSAYRLSRRYGELTMPVTIMTGAADLHALKSFHAERLHKALPQSELVEVPGAGHMVTHTAPRDVMAAIERAAEKAAA